MRRLPRFLTMLLLAALVSTQPGKPQAESNKEKPQKPGQEKPDPKPQPDRPGPDKPNPNVPGGPPKSNTSKGTTTAAKAMKHVMSAKGAITAMDATAKTITIGTNTYSLTDTTKFMGHGKAATMTDLKVGDTVSISYTKDGDMLQATRVTVTKPAKM